MSMEQVIAQQTRMHNLSSQSSSSGSSSCSVSSDVGNENDSWMDDLIESDELLSLCSSDSEGEWSCSEDDNDVLSYSQEDLTSLLDTNVFAEDSVVSPREGTEHEEEVEALLPAAQQSTRQQVFDTFSEAALTHREDPEASELGGDYDESEERDCCAFEGDELFLLFDDSMSIGGNSCRPSPWSKAPLGPKLIELTPRTTPRSPACPNVKRQRGVQQGSPFRLVVV